MCYQAASRLKLGQGLGFRVKTYEIPILPRSWAINIHQPASLDTIQVPHFSRPEEFAPIWLKQDPQMGIRIMAGEKIREHLYEGFQLVMELPQ